MILFKMTKYILFGSMDYSEENREICQLLSKHDIPFENLVSREARERGPALYMGYYRVVGLGPIKRAIDEVVMARA